MKYKLLATDDFNNWFGKIKDVFVKRRILARLARVENGNLGDYKPLDSDLYELRFFFAGGIRIYFTLQGHEVLLLLAGGEKSGQDRDIEKAKRILEGLKHG